MIGETSAFHLLTCPFVAYVSSADDGMPMEVEPKLEKGLDRSHIITAARDRHSVADPFLESEHSQWLAYNMDRRGERHDRVRADVEEATTAEPSLKAELEVLFRRVRRTASMPAGSSSAGVHATSEMEAEMAHVGASCLNSVFLELLAASSDEELPHIWASVDTPAPAAIEVQARFESTWGTLAVAPPFLTFMPGEAPAVAADSDCMECAEPLSWNLASFAGVDDDSEEFEHCELRLLQGEDDGLLFGFENAIQLAAFERTLRVASLSARAAATPAAAAEAGASSARGAGGSIADTTSDGASAGEQPKRQRKEEPRVARGCELKEALAKVASLYGHHKSAEAKAAMRGIPQGKRVGARSQWGRADELRSLLFTFGGLNTTKSILQSFLDMREVKLLLDEKFFKAKEEMADAKTATAMLHAAKRFLNEMLDRKADKTGGRLSDIKRNAFWASVVSMMPADLVENRQGRAMMRILGIQYRTVKKASTMRKQLEDASKGWVLLETSRHFDRAEKHVAIIDAWWHSDEASAPNNNEGKERVRVYGGYGIDPITGCRAYGLHDPRVQEGNDKHALSLWHKSKAAKAFQAATATPKQPQGIAVGRKLLVECRCECIKKRHASFADCKICSLVVEGLKNWHRHRTGWRQAKPGCTCAICLDPVKSQLYRTCSRSVRDMKAALLPCGQTAYPDYSIAGGPIFKCYPALCSQGKCPKVDLNNTLRGQPTPGACGWEHVFGKDCPVEASSDKFTWYRWEPKLRSENAEGKKFYSDEWVPHEGTRAEFLKELRASIKDSYLFHVWRHQLIRHAIKLHVSRKDGKTATEWSDYAAVLDLTRDKAVTCGVPERINELVTVMGYKPYEETVEVPKSRRHPATTKIVRKQHVDVCFAFHPTGFKSDARSYNVVQVHSCMSTTHQSAPPHVNTHICIHVHFHMHAHVMSTWRPICQ